MNVKSRRRIEMGTRALETSRAHPDQSPRYAAAPSRLEELLAAPPVWPASSAGSLQVRASRPGFVVLLGRDG